jgi:hypothetical protein
MRQERDRPDSSLTQDQNGDWRHCSRQDVRYRALATLRSVWYLGVDARAPLSLGRVYQVPPDILASSFQNAFSVVEL